MVRPGCEDDKNASTSKARLQRPHRLSGGESTWGVAKSQTTAMGKARANGDISVKRTGRQTLRRLHFITRPDGGTRTTTSRTRWYLPAMQRRHVHRAIHDIRFVTRFALAALITRSEGSAFAVIEQAVPAQVDALAAVAALDRDRSEAGVEHRSDGGVTTAATASAAAGPSPRKAAFDQSCGCTRCARWSAGITKRSRVVGGWRTRALDPWQSRLGEIKDSFKCRPRRKLLRVNPDQRSSSSFAAVVDPRTCSRNRGFQTAFGAHRRFQRVRLAVRRIFRGR